MALSTFQGPVRSMGGSYNQGPESVVALTVDTTINVGIAYRFLFLTSSGDSTTIQMTTAANLFHGSIVQGKAGLGLVHVFEPNGSSNNALIFDGTTTGGVAGTDFTITAIYANKYHVQGVNLGSGTLATPFSG